MENEKSENKSIIKIIVVSASIVAIAILLFGVASVFFSEKQHFAYDNITSYSINLENAEITVSAVKGNVNHTEVEVQTTGLGTSTSFSPEEKNGILHILQPAKSNLIPNIGGSTKVVVSITVNNDDALNDFVLNTKSGSIKIDNVDAKTLNISSHSGKVYLKDTVSDELIVNTQSGEIELENIEANYLENTSESGKCTVNFSNVLAQLTAVSKSSSGDVAYIFHNDILLNLSWSARNVTSDIESSEKSSNKLYFESESGNIRIVRSYP